MRIYDCFTFYNELDLLELRLKILDPYVDFFVLVEATKTKKGDRKKLYFKENKERFKKWEKKIIHVVVEDMPNVARISFNNFLGIDSKLNLGRWRLETYQINQIRKGLKNCKNEDIILVSDLDEIPNPKKFSLMKQMLNRKVAIGFNQKFYYYYLNGLKKVKWCGTKACTYKNFRTPFGNSAARVRRMRSIFHRMFLLFGKKEYIIEEGGWHFSYLLTPEKILEKMKALCGQEFVKKQYLSKEHIKKSIEKGEDLFQREGEEVTYIPIDESFPEEIQKNKRKYSKFIKEV